MAAARPYRPAADAAASPGQRFASRAASASTSTTLPPAYLQIQEGDGGTTRVVPLGVTPVRIGRGIQCEVRLAQVGLGDIQCMIRRRGDDWHFQPIGPPGRIWIDGRPADSQRTVAVGASIQVGRSLLTIHQVDPTLAQGVGSFDAPITVGGGSTTPPTSEAFDPAPTPADPPAEPEPTPVVAESITPAVAPEPITPAPEAVAAATSDESPAADRARRWQSRLDQRDQWLQDRQSEKRWEARWRAAGESIRARSGRPETSPQPPEPEPTRPSAAPTPPPTPPPTNYRPAPGRPSVVRPAEPRPIFTVRSPRPEPTTPVEPVRVELRPEPATTPPPPVAAVPVADRAEPVRPEPVPPAVPPSAPPRPTIVIGRVGGPIRPAPMGRDAGRPDSALSAEPGHEQGTARSEVVDLPALEEPRPVPRRAAAADRRPQPAATPAPPTAGADQADDRSLRADLAVGSPPLAVDRPHSAESTRAEVAPLGAGDAPLGSTFDDVEAALAGFEPPPTEVTPEVRAPEPVPQASVAPAPAAARTEPAPTEAPARPAPVPIDPPAAVPPPHQAGTRVEWPRAQAIFAAQATRAVEPVAEARPDARLANSPTRSWRPSGSDPEPTQLARPEAWSVPALLGGGIAALVVLGAGLLAVPLTLVWMQDDLGGAEAVRLATRPEGTRAPFLPTDGEALTRTAWWQTTAGHLAAWALTLNRLGPGEDRSADALALEADARAASPLGARARFLSEPAPGHDADDSGTIRLGPTRDVATLSAMGGRLRRLGQRDDAVRAYREAFRLAASTPRATLGVPPFRPDEQMNRYALPHSILLDDVARAMVGSGEWTPEEWREAVPEFGPALLAVASSLRAEHPGDADRRLDALAGQDPDTPLDPHFEPAEHCAALGEALAERGRWTDALARYRLAIERETRDLDRRVWWFNLAEVAGRSGDVALRNEAIDKAKGADLGDEVTKRAAGAHGYSGVARR